jgi:hypothetical protein
MATSGSKFDRAIAAFDAANAEDPNRESRDGVEQPKELAYARHMTEWLERLEPNASEALRLAVRAQHIRRWTIPRGDYPKDRQGYIRWRNTLAKFHADTAAQILRHAGYDEDAIKRVGSLIRKERIKLDPAAQLLEDVACLVFLENYFSDFARHHDEAQVVGIVRKTWKKMSPRGHAAALALPLSPDARALVEKALRRADTESAETDN